MPAGQPTKYNAKKLAQAKAYIENWEDYGDVIPSQIRLALILEVAEKTIDNWGKAEGNDEFLQTLRLIHAKQHMVLLNKGLSNEFNSVITKLALCNHGHSEKTDTKHSGAVGMVDLSDKTEAELKEIINGND